MFRKTNQEKQEQKWYKIVNRNYQLSKKGKLTMKRIKAEKVAKAAIILFVTSLVVIVFLFSYIAINIFSEKAFAKKPQINEDKNQELKENVSLNNKESEFEEIKTATATTSEQLVDPINDATNNTTEATNTFIKSDSKNNNLIKIELSEESSPSANLNNTNMNNLSNKENTNVENVETSNSNKKEELKLEELKTINKSLLVSEKNNNLTISSLDQLGFINAGNVSLFDSPESKKEIAKIRYGTFVKVLEKYNATDTTYNRIVYSDDESSEKQGWVKSIFITNISSYIKPSSSNIVFEPIKKIQGRVKNVRGIYISHSTATKKSNLLEKYLKFAKRNNINTFVIDVKGDDGQLLFKSEAANKHAPAANNFAVYSKEELKEIINTLKAEGIYLIARIVCFKDPTYARTHKDKAIIYKDTGELYTGIYKIPWASAYDRELWDYNIEVAKEAAEIGFDEIQYDYVRFPEISKELRKEIDLRNQRNETMFEAIYKFLLKSKIELSSYNVPLAADIFGLVPNVLDDLGIGQQWELVSNVVDYICPMVYPSHYANGSFKLPVPDAYPYETVYNSVLSGVVRNRYLPSPAKIRPWIQAFTATWVKGHITYGENEIRKQIKALKDLGINEFMLWNASNRYIEMKYE